MNKWTPLTFRNREWRMQVMAEKIEDGTHFELLDGTKIYILYDKKLIDALNTCVINKFNTVKHLLRDLNGNKLMLSHIGKTPVFGGKGVGNTSEDLESYAIKMLNEQLSKIGKPVCIRIGKDKKYYKNIIGARKSKNLLKSDIELYNKNGKTIVWLSHKGGSTAKHFQQWSGVKHLLQTPETKSFIKSAGVYTLKGGKMLTRKVKSDYLKCIAIYGNEYTKAFGESNVNAVIQGNIHLLKQERSNNKYKLTSIHGDSHVFINGELPPKDYEPVFYARYCSKSKNCVRMMFYPNARVRIEKENVVVI